MSNRSSAPSSNIVDFQLLRRCARNEMAHRLETAGAGGKVDLFIEDTLMKPLDRVAGASLLRDHGVDKIFRFDPSSSSPPWGGAADCRIYLVRPTLANAKYVADQVAAADRSGAIGKSFVVLFWPRKFNICEMIFEQQGVFGRTSLDEFNPFFIPLDTDFLSLELPDFFHSTYLDGTNIWFRTIAQGLLQLQSMYDAHFSIYGLGRAAEEISNLFFKLSEERTRDTTSLSSASTPFTHVFLFDRDLDYASVFLSCLTYEALLDDIFSINSGFAELPAESSQQKEDGSSQTAKVLLSNETDPIYSEIRYEHFSRVLEQLKWKVRELQTTSDKRHTIEKITDFKEFVTTDLKNVKQRLRLLSLHISSCESINAKKSKENFEEFLRREHEILAGVDYKECLSFIEDCACQQIPETTTLSLLCLLSLCQNGISSKDYQNLRRQYLHAYGHKHMTTLFNLKKLGILTERLGPSNVPSVMQNVVSSIGSPNFSSPTSKGPFVSNFQATCKKFNLTPEPEVDWKNQGHPSYVFNGAYIPALCEIVDRSLSVGFQRDDFSKTFGRPAFAREFDPTTSLASSPALGKSLDKHRVSRSQTTAGVKPVVLVCFLGGVTYAEMAALQWIGNRRNCRIVVATTHVINRDKFLKSIMDRI